MVMVITDFHDSRKSITQNLVKAYRNVTPIHQPPVEEASYMAVTLPRPWYAKRWAGHG